MGRSSTAFSAHVRVEQQHRARGRPAPARPRSTGRDRAARRSTSSGRPFVSWTRRERQPAEVVVGVVVLLMAVGVDRLAEVALAVEQADADERQRHVAGRLHVVAGEDAQAAGVDAERLVEPVLGAEVGDRARRACRRGGAGTSGPSRWPCSGRSRRGRPGTRPGTSRRRAARPVGRAADDRDGVAIAVPRRPVDEAPEVARLGVPRPVEVVGEAPEALESRWERERGGRDRRDGDGVHGRA